MDENTKKLIKERFDALPESIKEVILSSNYEESLIEIGKQHQLTVEQMGILERETTLVMMGLNAPKNFENDLIRELKVDKTIGNKIVTEINEKIFLKIRELLKLMNTPEGEDPSLREENYKSIENQINTNNSNILANTEKDIMQSAGIEILNGNHEKTNKEIPPMPKPAPNIPAVPPTQMVQEEKLELEAAPVLTKTKVEAIKNIEIAQPTPISNEIHPIIAEKLTGPVQTESIKTEHSPENNSKATSTTPYPKGADPYRLPPE